MNAITELKYRLGKEIRQNEKEIKPLQVISGIGLLIIHIMAFWSFISLIAFIMKSDLLSYIFIGLYPVLVIFIGIKYSKKQKSLNDKKAKYELLLEIDIDQ